MAQPNFPAIGNHLQGVQDRLQDVQAHVHGIQNEVGLVPNIPALVGIDALQQQINVNHLQIVALLGQMQEQIAEMQNEQQLLPIRLHNSAVSSRAPLRYPVGIPVAPPLPPTRHALLHMTGNQCQAVAAPLGLPHLPAAATVAQRGAGSTEPPSFMPTVSCSREKGGLQASPVNPTLYILHLFEKLSSQVSKNSANCPADKTQLLIDKMGTRSSSAHEGHPSPQGSVDSSAGADNIRGDCSGNSGSGNQFNSNNTINYGTGSSDKEADILQYLYKTSYESHRGRVREPAEGTCTWVTEHQKYKDWLEKEKSGLLWLSADPGCGKSVTASFLIWHLKTRTDAIVCYFLFKDDSDEQRSPAFALCALLHQHLTQRNSL
ncbi:hypothetical protein C7212DRAFT_366754 [Tuber magnatum]|uniref:Nephrocystin 3-like N-terminal domain-containing protein n=1 Tax=Tuber magnatum TaxID=42249 RepID=A0A317SCE7_9PEZI|nr:hypothetical protein C7212DRAFT_366754 [Tuber magnatum]